MARVLRPEVDGQRNCVTWKFFFLRYGLAGRIITVFVMVFFTREVELVVQAFLLLRGLLDVMSTGFRGVLCRRWYGFFSEFLHIDALEFVRVSDPFWGREGSDGNVASLLLTSLLAALRIRQVEWCTLVAVQLVVQALDRLFFIVTSITSLLRAQRARPGRWCTLLSLSHRCVQFPTVQHEVFVF